MKKILLLVVIICLGLGSCKNEDPKEENKNVTALPKKEAEAPPIENGHFVNYHKNGKKKSEGEYKNGQKDGRWTAWYQDGKVWSEAEFKEGKKEGASIVYYPNGKKRYEGSYENDQRKETWRYWDEAGNLVKEEEVK